MQTPQRLLFQTCPDYPSDGERGGPEKPRGESPPRGDPTPYASLTHSSFFQVLNGHYVLCLCDQTTDHRDEPIGPVAAGVL